MAPVIEVAFVPLAAGTDFENPSSPSRQIMKESAETLQQQDGYRRAFIGRQVENPSVAEMVIG